QMAMDEVEHGAAAQRLGAIDTPAPVKALMGIMGKVMTKTAYYI
ncbi:MAG: demethoxyubiquinone hydroxylase family protein, partial [Janthinobacterium sp.]